MLKHGYILILILAVCVAAVARVVSIAHSRVDRKRDHRSTSNSGDFGSNMRQIAGAKPQNGKRWVLDEMAFRNLHGDRSWIIGRSQGAAMSEAEAIKLAHEDAAGQLFPIIVSRASAWPGDRRWLESRIDLEVDAGKLETDTCIERFDRPYGSVYAGSVLLDVSANRMEPVIRDAKFELMARHRKAGLHIAIAGALLTFTWLGYVLLNSITRGYATGRLRFIAAAMTVGVLLLA